MAVEAVVGLQWGDEGKGKFVDERAAGMRAVMRYQGGANAGHTVLANGRRLAFHQVPAGAAQPGVTCIIGAGCAVDPVRLRQEVEALGAAGCPLGPGRLVVSGRAQVVLPWMVEVDAAEEALRGSGAIGTTRRGIGPACAAKAGRWGMTVGTVVDAAERTRRLAETAPWTDRWLGALGLGRTGARAEEGALAAAAEWLRPLVGDDLCALERAGGRVLLEGQLGVMRDPDRGSYPYVTGASVLPPAALVGPGARIVGVAKPYVTIVGGGAFPTEAPPREAAALRGLGGEFGASTGRARRCGWLDLPALRYAARAAGATHLAVTKCDVAAAVGRLPVCVRYAGWDEGTGYPLPHQISGVQPVYETWAADGSAGDLARRIAAAVGLPLVYAGTGPARGDGVWFAAA